MVEIRKIKHGIANAYPKENIIELNEKLDEEEFISLKSKILKHEMEHIHSKKKGFWKQREIDARTEISFKDIFKFIKKYPSNLFYQYFPITYHNKTLFIEWSLIFLYILFGGILFFIIYIIKIFSVNQQAFWRILEYLAIGLVITFFLYKLGKRAINYINRQAKKQDS
jgi:hypothetical protein